MAIKDILLHLDNSPSCPSRIEFAVNLARSHGAHLKGLYVLTHPYYTSSHGKGEADQIEAVRSLFVDKAGQAGISAEWLYVDWSVVGVGLSEVVDLYAYYSDLLIVGQPDHASRNAGTPDDLPERLGLGIGRPLLVVPYTGTFSSEVKRVMVAWKTGRESSRIIHDALPILKKAAHVSIVTVGAQGQPDDSVERDALSVCTYLARHGITASHDWILTSSSFPIGDVLLNHACEQTMDLLAMGAFAPTRRGAFVLGPIARHLMAHMTVPVLISH